jgi:two-component system response regulator YesN
MNNKVVVDLVITMAKQIAEPSYLKHLLSSFTEATGMRATIFDAGVEPVFGVEDYAYHCQFCQLLNSVAEGADRCRDSYCRACKSIGLIDPYIFFCHAGLVNWASTFQLDENSGGTIICGQAVMWPLDEQAIQDIFNKVADLGLPPRELKAAIRNIKVVPARQVQQAAEMLKKLAVRATAAGQELKREQEKDNSLLSLWDWLVEMAPWEHGRGYQLTEENELAARVRLGDRLGAETILEKLLGNILFTNIGRPEIIKYRLLELLAVLSRAAVAGGARAEEVLGLSAASMEKVAKMSLEESLISTVKAMEDFIDCVYKVRDSRQTPPVEKAVAYINNNYARSISLEDIAAAVGLSPAYLSRLFKKAMGRTVIDYLTLVRIEAAKRMLLEGKATMEEIAVATGFNEATYFNRVFKREVGISPGVFRSRLTQ